MGSNNAKHIFAPVFGFYCIFMPQFLAIFLKLDIFYFKNLRINIFFFIFLPPKNIEKKCYTKKGKISILEPNNAKKCQKSAAMPSEKCQCQNFLNNANLMPKISCNAKPKMSMPKLPQ